METQTIKNRICPGCSRSNHVDAWNCAECGRTLGVGTISELGKRDVDFPDQNRLKLERKASDSDKMIPLRNAAKAGAPKADVRKISPVERPLPTISRDEAAEKYRKKMLSGFLWAAGGLLLTSMSYQAASPGGTYFIFYGAIVFGGIDFLVGLIGWLSN